MPEHERERALREVPRDPEPADPQRESGRPDSLAVLGLQRRAGNHAVANLLARNGAPVAASPQQLFDDAIKDEKWDSAVTMLDLSFRTRSERHKALTFVSADALRYLDDAAKRSGLKRKSGVRTAVRRALREFHGFDDDHDETGRGFGRITVEYGAATNGDSAAGTNYQFPMKAKFKPDPKAVAAEEIAFIQRVRLVDTATGANLDPRHNFQMRATADASTVDRLPDRKMGYYGYDNTGDPSGTIHPWKSSAPKDTAWMTDRPQWNQPDSTWEFETAAVCKKPAADTAKRKGDPEGFVYATITWGFTVDDKLKITPMEIREFNKPSSELIAAVGEWNAQANLPDEDDRNDPDQEELPDLI